jgi:glucose-1-phosphate thymidylyltransferase
MQNIKEKINKVLLIKENLEKDMSWLKKGKKKFPARNAYGRAVAGGKKGIYFGKNVVIEPNVYFDVSEGEIVIDDETKIKAGSILRGPLYIGLHSTVNSLAEVSSSRIGDHCKVGGEVDHVFMQSYSNKQHYGYLGWSYIGSWVNVGGGTSIATLKNTYTNLKVDNFDTGSQFFGCIMNDYVKTAINTSVFCGKIIGESAHLYGTVTEDVPAFTSHVRAGVFYEIPLEVAENIQIAMTKRRNVKWTDADSKNFEKLFKETAKDRKLAKVKKGKLSFK